jgi:hypothetical protein
VLRAGGLRGSFGSFAVISVELGSLQDSNFINETDDDAMASISTTITYHLTNDT